MKRLIKLVLLFGLICLAACVSNEKTDISTRQIKVVATTGMIADLVKNIGGDRVAVKALMGPGVDPHLYKATEGDVRYLNEADIIFYNGLHLEAKLSEILEKLGKSKPSIAISSDIDRDDLISPQEYQGLYDPHIWFDVELWQETIETVEVSLSKLDSKHAKDYEHRAEAYEKALDLLNQEVEDLSADIDKKQRVLVTAHDAFNYFGKAYGFQLKALQGISTDSEAGVKDVQELANYLYKNKIPAIFIESSIPKRNIEAVRQAVKAKGWNVEIGGELFSDAMGDEGTVEGTYIGMFKHNIHTIHKALTQTGEE